MINKHKSNKIKENSNTVRHLNNGTDHRHSKSPCDQSSPARRTMRLRKSLYKAERIWISWQQASLQMDSWIPNKFQKVAKDFLFWMSNKISSNECRGGGSFLTHYSLIAPYGVTHMDGVNVTWHVASYISVGNGLCNGLWPDGPFLLTWFNLNPSMDK